MTSSPQLLITKLEQEVLDEYALVSRNLDEVRFSLPPSLSRRVSLNAVCHAHRCRPSSSASLQYSLTSSTSLDRSNANSDSSLPSSKVSLPTPALSLSRAHTLLDTITSFDRSKHPSGLSYGNAKSSRCTSKRRGSDAIFPLQFRCCCCCLLRARKMFFICTNLYIVHMFNPPMPRVTPPTPPEPEAADATVQTTNLPSTPVVLTRVTSP